MYIKYDIYDLYINYNRLKMKNLLDRETVTTVKNFLKKNNLYTSIILLDKTARSASEAAESLNVKTGAIIKSIIFKSLTNTYYVCLVSGDKTVSIKKLSILTNSNIIKPNANEIKNITGYSIGGVPPIAHKKKLPTYIDSSLSRYNEIYGAAGHPHCVFKIDYLKICQITDGYICDITN